MVVMGHGFMVSCDHLSFQGTPDLCVLPFPRLAQNSAVPEG